MQFGVREAASLFGVPEKTINRWISQDGLPAHKVHEQYRFNRSELIEWATERKRPVSADILNEPESKAEPQGLFDSLTAGGVHYHLPGADKLAVLKSIIDVMPLPKDVDRSFILSVLVAREKLSSTAVGDGIAMPHVRNPIVMHIPHPMITLCFLDKPVEFGALDGKPVYALFTLVSPTVAAHLGMLSRLAFALHQGEFAALIARQAAGEEILRGAAAIDSAVRSNQSLKAKGDQR
jgi:PTS system nitrogen regulatory IIA component